MRELTQCLILRIFLQSSNITIHQNFEFTVPLLQNTYCDHRNFDGVNQP